MTDLDVFNLIAGGASIISLLLYFFAKEDAKKDKSHIEQKAGKKSILVGGNFKISKK